MYTFLHNLHTSFRHLQPVTHRLSEILDPTSGGESSISDGGKYQPSLTHPDTETLSLFPEFSLGSGVINGLDIIFGEFDVADRKIAF